MSVACANNVHRVNGKRVPAHHLSVAAVRLCFARHGIQSVEEAEAAEIKAAADKVHAEREWEDDPDAAYERFLETRETSDGPLGADGLYDYERNMGCIGFEEAMANAERAAR